MKKINLPIIGAVITALLSTLCCLPAFLFIFFGISSGLLSYFTTFTYARIPLAILTIILFIYGIKKYMRNNSCECTKKEKIKKSFFISFLLLFFLFVLLYPELIPLFME
ncbi:transporter [Halarcobacter ebronensis]|uniref:Transporter n=1 Tax=Halarcobacter ebronensis TaxID=1462615 RepID=A0A4Q1AQ77_9BACT|nr:transporter [Halarcobacter ebronensis]QKF81790.1 putative mercuric transport protein MerT [Halarcobacter ebronensis]RXK04537.1 transporter [Halarcobacter ebronensis]